MGTFTADGTFEAMIDKLPHLKNLGINALQLMPIADFPGSRNWGYDGVQIYAPAHAYGSPDKLKALVDKAHAFGIAVILDVVYNHLGAEGNYLPALTSKFFSETHQTPWGNGFNFDGQHAEGVRMFFTQNPVYWMEEFHIDGFRLDATHEIKDDSKKHILHEIAELIQKRGCYVIAEDERNDVTLLEPRDSNGHGFDAVWADDFHHETYVSQTQERHAYFQDFEGTPEEMVAVLSEGWLYQGQKSQFTGKKRGSPAAHLPPSKFIHCITNHDQVGNRALGERLNTRIRPESYRAISMLLCLTPYTPMFFMGQEWGAGSPFLFFTDIEPELGKQVTEGRRREFAHFPEFGDTELQQSIPDPQNKDTFEKSKLNWDEMKERKGEQIFSLYQECLSLRNRVKLFRPTDREGWSCKLLNSGIIALRFFTENSYWLLLVNLWGPCEGNLSEETLSKNLAPWELLLSSNEKRFGGDGAHFDSSTQTFAFSGPEILFLESSLFP